MRLSRFVILLFIATLIAISCSTRPSSVLSEKKMEAVLQDMYLADAIFKSRRDEYKTDTQKDALINGVLKKHGISQAELDSSLVWYADNIEKFTQIQDTVSTRVQRQNDRMVMQITHQSTYQLSSYDTTLPEYYSLDVTNPTFRFRIDSNKVKTEDVSDFKLSFRAVGVDSSQHRIDATIYYRYRDTTIVDKVRIVENRFYEFFKPQHSDSLLHEISGYIHMAMATDKMTPVLFQNIKNKEEKELPIEESDENKALSTARDSLKTK